MNRFLLLAAAILLAGCSNKTETGYEPRKLGDSLSVQRGYYATPFSPEARQASQERGDTSYRRPTSWNQ